MATCDAQELGPTLPVANDAHVGAPPARAKQVIPPARRRAVLQRDQRRCRVPGCCNATFLDVHHVVARKDGGGNEADNLITLCGAHHRAVHRGQLLIEREGAQVRFRHADGRRYGEVATPYRTDVFAKVSAALRNLGFERREICPVLDELRQDADLASATREEVLRRAVIELTAR